MFSFCLRFPTAYLLFFLGADLADDVAFPAGEVLLFLESEGPLPPAAVFFSEVLAPAAFPFAFPFSFCFGGAAALLPLEEAASGDLAA